MVVSEAAFNRNDYKFKSSLAGAKTNAVYIGGSTDVNVRGVYSVEKCTLGKKSILICH